MSFTTASSLPPSTTEGSSEKGMIALARSRGFSLGWGLEARLERIQKRLEDVAPDLPCLKWSENAGGAALRAG